MSAASKYQRVQHSTKHTAASESVHVAAMCLGCWMRPACPCRTSNPKRGRRAFTLHTTRSLGFPLSIPPSAACSDYRANEVLDRYEAEGIDEEYAGDGDAAEAMAARREAEAVLAKRDTREGKRGRRALPGALGTRASLALRRHSACLSNCLNAQFQGH